MLYCNIFCCLESKILHSGLQHPPRTFFLYFNSQLFWCVWVGLRNPSTSFTFSAPLFLYHTSNVIFADQGHISSFLVPLFADNSLTHISFCGKCLFYSLVFNKILGMFSCISSVPIHLSLLFLLQSLNKCPRFRESTSLGTVALNWYLKL